MNTRKAVVPIVLLLSCLGNTLAAESYRIDRVEPAFWWTGFEHRELQLLVYGTDIAEMTPSIDAAGIDINRVVRVHSPNYLFLYLNLGATAASGDFDIVFSGGDQVIRHAYKLLDKNPDPAHARGFSAADAIYLITPDRFANGDPDNDNVTGMGDEADRSALGGRHGGDIKGVLDHLDYIGDLGFTAIWLNPLLENRMPEYSYHGYATTDFYKVDERFGSNDDYRNLVATAKRNNIGTIMDMIVNHCGSEHWWMHDLPSADWVNYPQQYTTHERTTNQSPYASEYDKRAFADGWFAPTMPDLNQRNPLLADYLIQNALWWIEYLGLTGIRMDTYPYPDKHFMTRWTQRVMQEYPEFGIVGEEWSLNPAITSYWQRGKQNHDGYVSYMPSVMDFPLQDTLVTALKAPSPSWGSSWTPLYEMLGNDFLYPDPAALVIFPDNHDMSRIFTQLEEDYARFRMAMLYLLTIRGAPQLYYGTEILMVNRESTDHGLIRSDFPGGWASDDIDAVSGEGMSEQSLEAQALLRLLLGWRKQKTVIHSGKLMQFSPIGEVFVYFRYNDEDTVMVVLNKGADTVQLDVSRFVEILGDARSATDVISGDRIALTDRTVVGGNSILLLEVD